MSLVETVKNIREQINKYTATEDIAYSVIEDMKAKGFQCELTKPRKSPKSWKIVLTTVEPVSRQKEFETLKAERVDYWRDQKMEQLRQLKKAVMK